MFCNEEGEWWMREKKLGVHQAFKTRRVLVTCPKLEECLPNSDNMKNDEPQRDGDGDVEEFEEWMSTSHGAGLAVRGKLPLTPPPPCYPAREGAVSREQYSTLVEKRKKKLDGNGLDIGCALPHT
jgi:hypothetical protein